MAAPSLPALPPILKQLQHYLKTAIEYDKRDAVVSYYSRLYAVQRGIKIDSKSTESKTFLFALMDYLEKKKTELTQQGVEAVSSDIVGQAHMESVALNLFQWADNQDRSSIFNKNVVKSFYTAGLLFDVLSQFGDCSDEVDAGRKYAKWKAAYLHKCLKNGETPIPGPMPDGEDEEGAEAPPPGLPPQPHEPGNNPPYPPPSNMNLDPTNLHPTPHGAHAPPSTPQDPPPHASHSPKPAPRATPQPPAASASSTADWAPPPNPYGVQLTAIQYQKGMKFCKFAISAMQYEDTTTAIDNLNKALKLLTTGQDS